LQPANEPEQNGSIAFQPERPTVPEDLTPANKPKPDGSIAFQPEPPTVPKDLTPTEHNRTYPTWATPTPTLDDNQESPSSSSKKLSKKKKKKGAVDIPIYPDQTGEQYVNSFVRDELNQLSN
jgi:hypothetical protein